MVAHEDGSVTYTANELLAIEHRHHAELQPLHAVVGLVYEALNHPDVPDYLLDVKHHFLHYAGHVITELRTLAGKETWEV
jgi:hypothetical protein